MTWSDSFKQGIQLFRQGKHEESLNKFNEAILKNSKEKSVYDSRAAAFEKLDRPVDALRDSKKVIDLAPGSWQGYARSARLFLQIKKPEASLKMAELALERLKGSDEKRRVELDALKQQALKDLEPPPRFFSKLPVEICSEIFALVAGKSSSNTLALTLVCRGWREIILNMPSLWRRLVLTPKTSGKKVNAWLKRSKGTLSSLEIRNDFNFDARPNILRYASESFWAKLESLKVTLSSETRSVDQALPSGAVAQLQLQALEVNNCRQCLLYVDDSPLKNLDMTRLSSLVIDWIGTSWKYLLPCTVLRTLNIQGDWVKPRDIFSVLAQNPLLETLILASVEVSPQDPVEISEPIELIHLRHLHLSVTRSTNVYFRYLRFPNLEALNIERAGMQFEDRRCLDVLVEQSLPHLTDLRFSQCGLERLDVLVPLLQSAHRLKRFACWRCLETKAVSTVLTALAEQVPSSYSQEGAETDERPICCPRLQHLDFTRTADLKAGPIVRLVKAHFPPADVPLQRDSDPSTAIVPPLLQLPIQTLILDDCDAFDSDALTWLRAKVPQVNFKMSQFSKVRIRGLVI
ncbi:hypothetical protein DFH11DRAFT_1519218 [Phellopilus nigrolimitatus]|nr:hypothetical protein DFH11DRAFT_1519218 [Phellopilus nigrolimitatus]